MFKLFYFFKKAFTPITIMVIPHENIKSLSIKLPISAIVLSMLLCAVGSVQVFSLASKGLDYHLMAEKVNYFSRQFGEWNATLMGLKKSEQDFQRLFALGSREKVFENMETSFSGDIDWDSLKQEIEKAVTGVNEIKDYLRAQKDLYQATPKGFPVSGSITSPYGMRENPFGGRRHHAGVDISAREGSSVKAAADGIVSLRRLDPGQRVRGRLGAWVRVFHRLRPQQKEPGESGAAHQPGGNHRPRRLHREFHRPPSSLRGPA